MKKRASSLTRPEPTALTRLAQSKQEHDARNATPDTPVKRGPKKGQTINELKTPCKLFDARTKLNLSQSDLSRLSGVAQATISFIEDGTQRNPTRQIMVKLARALAQEEVNQDASLNHRAHERPLIADRRGRELLAAIFWE